ncbi:(Lyso)-N-acylphosphatidylethanolamine lipase isoform X6 [Dermacentor silvarum]|nr:(Lyso)-N-acylphosphatidylethanolamine lipase isoform X6 [Dermacentor silvarum]
MKLARWCPSSREQLQEAEEKIFSYLNRKYTGRYVEVGRFGDAVSPCRLWTITMKPESEEAVTQMPLVLIHGLGCGSALWVLNIEELSKNRVVHTLDLLGFGRSSRPSLGNDATRIEEQMVQSIEAWRQEMQLERFVLAGHSLGGFLSASYALCYPHRVAHLVLEDPWGFPVFDPGRPRGKRMGPWLAPLQLYCNRFNVLSGLRASGLLGPFIMQAALSGAHSLFGRVVTDPTAIPNYVYHCNVRRPTGEEAFRNLSVYFGWTKNPMVLRFLDLDPEVPVTFVYGKTTFITRSPAEHIKKTRINGYVDVQVVDNCGHNVHMDQPEKFNELVNKVCDLANSDVKLGSGTFATDRPAEE